MSDDQKDDVEHNLNRQSHDLRPDDEAIAALGAKVRRRDECRCGRRRTQSAQPDERRVLSATENELSDQRRRNKAQRADNRVAGTHRPTPVG